jgi:hypothetical protein
MADSPKTMRVTDVEAGNELCRAGQRLIEIGMALRDGFDVEIEYEIPAEFDPWPFIGPSKTRYKGRWAEFIAHAPEDIRYLLGLRNAVLAIHRRGMIYTSGSTGVKHKPPTEFRCTDDHLLWPCPTVIALGGEK